MADSRTALVWLNLCGLAAQRAGPVVPRLACFSEGVVGQRTDRREVCAESLGRLGVVRWR
jgi:hypothetical protein